MRTFQETVDSGHFPRQAILHHAQVSFVLSTLEPVHNYLRLKSNIDFHIFWFNATKILLLLDCNDGADYLSPIYNFLVFQSSVYYPSSVTCLFVSLLLQVTGTILILFALSPQLAPILGLLMLTVSVLVGKYFLLCF